MKFYLVSPVPKGREFISAEEAQVFAQTVGACSGREFFKELCEILSDNPYAIQPDLGIVLVVLFPEASSKFVELRSASFHWLEDKKSDAKARGWYPLKYVTHRDLNS